LGQAHITAMSSVPKPRFFVGFRRGLAGRCPNCGQGKIFRAYLKVEPVCSACGHDLARYPADDGPAYFTILIVGHLVIAPLLVFPFIWQTSPWIIVPGTLIPLLLLTLLLLPRIKGAFIGFLWFLGLRRLESAALPARNP
jgi:uncharacterized protein (DUF983 family)